MAFVYRAERKIGHDPSKKVATTDIGPGMYINPKKYEPKPQVTEPFKAQVSREKDKAINSIALNPADGQTKFNPGPGQYSQNVGFGQIQKSMENAKQIQRYGVEKYGITVIKPTGTFASKQQRFNQKTVKEKSNTPGPGQYSDGKSNWDKGAQNQ